MTIFYIMINKLADLFLKEQFGIIKSINRKATEMELFVAVTYEGKAKEKLVLIKHY